MNILLVYPIFPRSFWSFAHALKIQGSKALLPPLGLLTVAAMLPQPWNKRLVDLNVRELTDEDLAWADYVFVSGMTVQRQSAYEVTARCKRMGKRVIGGGPLFAGEYALFTDVEHFMLNEGEVKECKKSQNRNRDMAEDVKTLQRAGIEVQAGFIVGFDHDTPATFQQQVDFIQRR